MDYMSSHLPELERTTGDTIEVTTPGHEHAKSWLLESMRENRVPDIMLAHASDFSVLENGQAHDLFSPIAGEYAAEHPLRDELELFKDPEGLFYPLFIVPMVMIYNKKLVNEEELLHSWTDLLATKWTVAFPDKDTPISKAVMAHLKKNHACEYEAFKNRVVFLNSPVEVIQAVAMGQYHLGIANISFSMMAKQRNVEINWPMEGPIPVPQVLVWKKQANPLLRNIADLLTNHEIQQYLGKQGFWPVGNATHPGSVPLGGNWKNTWVGWESFMQSIKELGPE